MILNGIDGINHINVYSKGKTKLGKWLSNFTNAPISLPEGQFDSIEGYWYYLLTNDERLKSLSGFEAKKLGQHLVSKESSSKDQEFIDKIKFALDVKLKTYREYARLLGKSILPLCHYYIYNDKKFDGGSDWIIQHLEERRKLLKEHYRKK